MKSLYSVAFFMLLVFPVVTVSAQTSEYLFQVDMQYAQLKPHDEVIVRGSGPTLGNWAGADVRLKRRGRYYQAAIDFPSIEVGAERFYNYIILRADGSEQGESRLPRAFIVGSESGPPEVFNDVKGPMLIEPISLHMEVDLTEAVFNGEPPAGVGLSGGPLGMAVPALELFLDETDGLWKGKIPFESLMPADHLLQFFFLVDGRWIREPLGFRHAILLRGTDPVLRMRFDSLKGHLVAYSSELMADDFEAIIDAVDANKKKSLYALYAALDRLDSGDLPEANGFFNSFLQHNNDELLLDVYPRRYGYRLFTEGSDAEAIAHLKGEEAKNISIERKAKFAFDIGAGLLGLGRITESVENFEAAAQAYASITGKAVALGKALAEIDSSASIAALEGLMNTNYHRVSLLALAHAASRAGLFEEASAHYEALTEAGTTEQQIKARIRALEARQKGGEGVLASIETLLSAQPNADEKEERLRQAAQQRHRKVHLLFLKAESLAVLERNTEASALFELLANRYADTLHGKKATSRLP